MKYTGKKLKLDKMAEEEKERHTQGKERLNQKSM